MGSLIQALTELFMAMGEGVAALFGGQRIEEPPPPAPATPGHVPVLPADHEPTPAGTAAFLKCLSFTLKEEGGFSNDPRDPGHATNLGVTIATLSDWEHRPATVAEVRGLTMEDVQPIYRTKYWNAAQCGAVNIGVAMALFDFAVNSGVARGVRILQECVGADPDGEMGEITIGCCTRTDPETAIRKLCSARKKFLMTLPTWTEFGQGWGGRVDRCQAYALKLMSQK